MARDGEERGPYVSRSRALEYERQLAKLEGRLQERIDRLERQLAAVRAAHLDGLRAQIAGGLELLRTLTGAEKEDA